MKMKKKLVLFLCFVLCLVSQVALADGITKDGYCNGIKMKGKVRIVEYNPDVKVQVVTSFPDLKVKVVDHFADDIGEWQFVEYGEDFTIKFVTSFPDLRIKYVTSFPGVA